MADDRAAALAEAYKRGILPPDMTAAYEAAQKRGLVGQPAAPGPQKDTSLLFSDDPNKEYGAILPFAQDKRTGKTEWAAPEIIRAPFRSADALLQTAEGKRYLTPEQKGMAGLDVIGALPASSVGKAAVQKAPEIADMAKSAAMKPIDAGERMAKVIRPEPKPPAITSAEDMKKVAAQYYGQAKTVGGDLSPQYVDKMLGHVGEPVAREKLVSQIFGEDEPTRIVAAMRQQMAGKPLTLAEAQGIDEELGRKISQHYTVAGLDAEGNDLREIQSKFRNSIMEAGEGDIIGDKTGFEALKKGRQTWSQAAKLRDIENIVKRSEYMDQPISARRAGFRSILANAKKNRGCSKEEIKALERAAKTGGVTDLFRAFGSRLTTYAAGAVGASQFGLPGLVAGETIGHFGSAASRSLADDMQMKRVQDLLQQIGMGAPPDATQILYGLGEQAK